MENGTEHSTYTSEKYPEKILDRIGQLRAQQELCDVTLEAEGISYPAHRVLLASASTYCKLLFADPKTGDPVQLKGVKAKGLKNVLDFIYTNKLRLSMANIEDTLKAAEVLLAREAVKLCFRFLEDHLADDNSLEILNLVKKHGPDDLKQKAGQHYRQILGNAESLVKVDKTTLCEILGREDMAEYRELDLFNFAVAWLRHDSSRVVEAGDVLRHIRFPLVPLEDLQKMVKETSILKTDSSCFRYLQDALSYHAQLYAQPVLSYEGTRIRSSTERLLVIGGRTSDNVVGGSIYVGDDGGSSWSQLAELYVPVYNHCTAVINDFLFVLGGQNRFDPTGKHPSNEVFRFDPRQGSWLQVAGMQDRRTRFHVEVVSERIVAVGGGTLLGHLTNTVEEYHPSENSWEFTAPFPVPVADHAGTTHKGILYISGGYSTGRTLSDVYSYLPRLRRWVMNRSMTFARCDHGMAAMGEKVYCVGGRTLNAAQEWIHVNETEVYWPAADQWSTLPLSPIHCCQFSITAHDSKLYITGGGSLRRMNKEEGVFIYDPEAKTWKKAGSLPCPLVDHASCAMKLPHHLTQKLHQKEENSNVSAKKKSTLNLFITGKKEKDLDGQSEAAV
ncbi:hypothetical protein XENTR_v10019996 [Xenopus tropicalis]|uniref:Kelch-like protein 9 n=1 Tax=Xenopus tropicalis TaxID=8364 RepID=A0A803K0F7_XENTR|nr:kelch-like protein 9 [Xenopus tropicalis]KAE8582208.1 hypothetical protein XENTR_v10019996 [Xenopus tropicalis]